MELESQYFPNPKLPALSLAAGRTARGGFDCLPLLVCENLLDFQLRSDQYFNPKKRYIS